MKTKTKKILSQVLTISIIALTFVVSVVATYRVARDLECSKASEIAISEPVETPKKKISLDIDYAQRAALGQLRPIEHVLGMSLGILPIKEENIIKRKTIKKPVITEIRPVGDNILGASTIVEEPKIQVASQVVEAEPTMESIAKEIANQITRDYTTLEIIELTNLERVSKGLEPLRENNNLSAAAYLKANDILVNDYFAHESPDGKTPWYWFEKVGYKYQNAGENLAEGYAGAMAVFDAWMGSPAHKVNIMNGEYTEIGVAAITGELMGQEKTVFVQLFGSI